MHIHVIYLSRLKLGRMIDEGAFGRVYLADAYGITPGRYKSIVAVKMIKGELSTKVSRCHAIT